MTEPSWEDTTPSEGQVPAQSPGNAPTWDSTVDPEERYGGLSGGLKSFLLGGARSSTFGLSDEFLARSGIMRPEDIKAYKEQNPISSGAGEFAGIAGSVLAPEEGILGALSAPVKGVSEAGQAVSKAAAEALPQATTTVGRILSQAGATAAGSAVEGAAYGLGQAVSENALGDPDALGEKLFSHVGMGALTGGALGGLIGTGAEAIPAVLQKAGIKTEALRNSAENALVKTVSKISGKSEGDLRDLLSGIGTEEGAAYRKNALEGMKEREEAATKFADNLAETDAAMNESKKQYYGGARQEEISNLMSNIPHEQAFNAAADMAGKLKDVTKAMRAEPEIYSATGRIKKLENISDGLERRLTDSTSSEEVYHAMNDAKGQIQDLTKWGGAPVPAEADTVNAIKSIGRDFRLHLENPSVYGEAGARQASLNSAASDFFSAQKNMVQSFGRKLKSGDVKIDPAKVNSYFNQIGRPGAEIRHEIFEDYLNSAKRFNDQMAESNANAYSKIDTNKLEDLFQKTQAHASGAESELEAINQYRRLKNFGERSDIGGAIGAGAVAHALGVPGSVISAGEAAYGLYSTLRHPADLIRVLSNVERAAMKVTNSINKGVSGIFKAKDVFEPSSIYVATKFASKEDKENDHDKYSEHLLSLSSDPEKMINTLSNKTDVLSTVAPNTAAGTQGAMLRATQFLKSKLPGAGVQEKPLSPKYKPSDAELSKWHKYFSIVENPTMALRQVASGTIGPETMETLQNVYPKMLNEMQTAVTDKLSEHVSKNKELPYQRKMALSLFLGSDLVNSLNPTSMLANQNTMATATQAKAMQQQIAQNHSVNQKNIGKIGKANRLLTDAQASAQRIEKG